MELIAADGRVIAETRTDEQGGYDFPALAPGEYGVRETQPAGWHDGPEQLGIGGAWTETGDWIRGIVVLPGADLRGYDFAELATVVEPLPPGGSAEGPDQAPLSLGRSVTALAGLALPRIETVSAAEPLVLDESSAASAAIERTPLAPLSQRPAARLFGSGGMLLEGEQELDFDAALSEGYDALAAMLEWFSEPGRPAPGAESADATTASAERPVSSAEEATPPASDQTEPTPMRRADGSHHLAGRSAG